MTMQTPIVVGHDGHSLGPLRTAELLAQVLELPLIIGTAYDYEPVSWGAGAVPPDVTVRREQHAEDVAQQALEALAAERDADCRIVPAVGRGAALLELAAEADAACLVVGPDLRGDVAHDVLSGATCPVVVAPAEALVIAPKLAVIGVAYDGSPTSRLALAAAARLAERAGAGLHVLTVVDRLPTSRAADLVAQAAAQVPVGVDLETSVPHGRAGAELRRSCEVLDLIACGSHGRGRIQSALLGSVSARLVDDAVCPVLVVPPRARRRPAEPLGMSTAGEAGR